MLSDVLNFIFEKQVLTKLIKYKNINKAYLLVLNR